MSVTMLPSWSLQKEGLDLNPSSFPLKEFPSIISAAMHLNFLAFRLQKYMLLPAKQVALFSPLLAVLQHQLQLTSMWPGMSRSSQLLPSDILRRIMLTSAVYDIQPFPQQPCARSG